mgnify:CR=1 FL=1
MVVHITVLSNHKVTPMSMVGVNTKEITNKIIGTISAAEIISAAETTTSNINLILAPFFVLPVYILKFLQKHFL